MRLLHSLMMCYIITLLCGLAVLSTPAEAQSAPKFPDRVQALLDSDWTELSIRTVVGSDDGRIIATAVKLKRETPKSSVYYSLPLAQAAPEKATVNEKDLQTLFTATFAAAKATFAHQYPAEIFNSLPPEKARAMIQSGALKIVPTDVEMLIIQGKTAAGKVKLDEFGPFSPLDTTIQTLFHTQPMEMMLEEYQGKFGIDPYAEQ